MNLPDEVRAAVEDWTDPYENADECAMLTHFRGRGLIVFASELRDEATIERAARAARREVGTAFSADAIARSVLSAVLGSEEGTE